MHVKTMKTALENFETDYPFLADRNWLKIDQEKKVTDLRQQLDAGNYSFTSLRYITEWQGRVVPALQFSAQDGLAIYALQLLLEEGLSAAWLPSSAWRVSQMDGLLGDIRLIRKPGQMALKTDVKRCFSSIPHKGLLNNDSLPSDGNLHRLLRQYFTALDRAALEYPEPVRQGIGLPLGTRINHMLAHHYLMPVDSALTKRTKLSGVFRYLDDILLLGEDKQELQSAFDELVSVLASSQLEVNRTKTRFFGKGETVRFLQADL